jgi:hypothetical protein
VNAEEKRALREENDSINLPFKMCLLDRRKASRLGCKLSDSKQLAAFLDGTFRSRNKKGEFNVEG